MMLTEDRFKIAVAGTGYVGLVVSVCLAQIGHQVTGVDVDQTKIDQLGRGIVPFYEADVDRLLQQNSKSGRLCFTTDASAAFSQADAIFIGVGTPELGDGSADLSAVYDVVRQIEASVRQDCLVVIKSTVPVGTCAAVERFLLDRIDPTLQVEVASCPEFLSQGTAVHDMLQADRILIGTDSDWAKDRLQAIYRPFGRPLVPVSRRSAELTKYAANSFLALKISFINEMARLCEQTGADIAEVARGLSYDRRIGCRYLNAGIGYGGSCLPKDTLALQQLAGRLGVSLRTVEATIAVNETQKYVLLQKAGQYLPSFAGKTIAILGLTFKPDTDDVRAAPSLFNVARLLELGAHIVAYDPVGIGSFRQHFPEGRQRKGEIRYVQSAQAAIRDADACFVFTEWPQIRNLQPADFAGLMRQPLVFDGRNLYDVRQMNTAGIHYESIGRPLDRSEQLVSVEGKQDG
ncbi:MAG: UDP-glucose/GDP-mannose dehydrogenase family protein [Bacillota bacterium]|nr:UDP-glucose/GDP-mannose dehydrogenase family protein [Bacillota bacterium]